MSLAEAALPQTHRPVRRIVTGLDEAGRSVILSDQHAPNVKLHTHAPMVAQVVWATDCAPASWSQAETAPAGKPFPIGPQNGGSILRIVDFPPDDQCDPARAAALFEEMGGHGARDTQRPRHFMFHRTETLDYAIVLEGEIWAMMDIGETLMKPGDVLIQRATNHSWSNRSDKPCRVAFVLLDAA
jgi:hypothetical protein